MVFHINENDPQEIISILEKAHLIEAYHMEGFVKLFFLSNDEIIAMTSYGSEDISIQVCNEEGDTKIVLCTFSAPGDVAVDWEEPAEKIISYIKDNNLSIVHVYDWEDAGDSDGSAFREMFNTRNFESLYRATVEDLRN